MTVTGQARSDEELVLTTLAGSHDSFLLLVRRYQHLVYGLCRNMLGCREDALDASQDAFLVAFKHLAELRREGDFRPWLRRIATNVCRQRLRARRTTADLEEDAAWIDPYRNADHSIDLDRALAQLSLDTRLAILLFYIEGSSVREIALFVGVPESTIMSRLRNARSQLRQELQTMFEQPTKQSSLPQDFADRIPIPYDEYVPLREREFESLLAWRSQWLLSAYPPNSTIASSEIIGHDWEAISDRAVQVIVRLPDGSKEPVILQASARLNGIQTDAQLLPLLANLGLNVPRIVAGPTIDPAYPDRGMMIATTPPVGQSALSWAVDGGIKAVDQACDVVMEGIEQIKNLTAAVEASAVGRLLERCSLSGELSRVVEVGGPWMSESRFTDAVARLEQIVQRIHVPLVFSDSGIGPNYRVDADGKLAGFDSFAWARIEDPHYQISKYWTYDCWPIRRVGFVERYLVRHNLSLQDFAPRLAIRALVTLQREIPLIGGDEAYRNDMLEWLSKAINSL